MAGAAQQSYTAAHVLYARSQWLMGVIMAGRLQDRYDEHLGADQGAKQALRIHKVHKPEAGARGLQT